MCGNGSRCAALFAHKILNLNRKFQMETKAGIILCQIKTSTVQVQLTDPVSIRSNSTVEVAGRGIPYTFINTGVPHAVVIQDDVEDIPVVDLGRQIRYHRTFQPKGANVDFIQKIGPRSLKVRTYERGVESETLACGTGATASAIVAHLSGLVKPPVEVKTRGGETLNINFKHNGSKVTHVTLEGNAQFIFEGSLLDVL